MNVKILLVIFLLSGINIRVNGQQTSENSQEIKEEYQRVKGLHQFASYEIFLKDYPNSPYADSVKSRVQQLTLEGEKLFDDLMKELDEETRIKWIADCKDKRDAIMSDSIFMSDYPDLLPRPEELYQKALVSTSSDEAETIYFELKKIKWIGLCKDRRDAIMSDSIFMSDYPDLLPRPEELYQKALVSASSDEVETIYFELKKIQWINLCKDKQISVMGYDNISNHPDLLLFKKLYQKALASTTSDEAEINYYELEVVYNRLFNFELAVKDIQLAVQKAITEVLRKKRDKIIMQLGWQVTDNKTDAKKVEFEKRIEANKMEIIEAEKYLEKMKQKLTEAENSLEIVEQNK